MDPALDRVPVVVDHEDGDVELPADDRAQLLRRHLQGSVAFEEDGSPARSSAGGDHLALGKGGALSGAEHEADAEPDGAVDEHGVLGQDEVAGSDGGGCRFRLG